MYYFTKLIKLCISRSVVKAGKIVEAVLKREVYSFRIKTKKIIFKKDYEMLPILIYNYSFWLPSFNQIVFLGAKGFLIFFLVPINYRNNPYFGFRLGLKFPSCNNFSFSFTLFHTAHCFLGCRNQRLPALKARRSVGFFSPLFRNQL